MNVLESVKNKKYWPKKIVGKQFWKELIHLALILIAIFAFRYSIAEPYVVPTGSMEPTILPGDRLFVYKAAYDWKVPFTDIQLGSFHSPQRGDIIVFKYPVDPSIFYIKRLIGLPGDLIEVTDGVVKVNGSALSISFDEVEKLKAFATASLGSDSLLLDAQYKELGTEVYWEQIGSTKHAVQRLPHLKSHKTLEFQVPEEHYFFMGDNRDNSNDSRFWGFVPRAYLKGKALVVYFSVNSSQGWLPSVRWHRFGQKL